jgi:hypothetical protein
MTEQILSEPALAEAGVRMTDHWIPVPQGYHSLRSKTYAGMTETTIPFLALGYSPIFGRFF